MNENRRSTLRLTAGGALLAASGAGRIALADEPYPNKPVRIVFPFAPGGGGDFMARFIAQQLTVAMGKSVYVENRPGAAGVTGIEYALRQPSDGYTLILISNSYTVNPAVYSVKFDSVKDITPIVQLSQGPLVVAANPKFPPNSTQELIALAKSKPGSINFASSGVGSAVHLATEHFQTMAHIKMTHVPYKSTGLAVNDVMGGQVDLVFAGTAAAVQQIKAGRLKAIAVTGTQRLAALPDVPTIAESGVPGYEMILWHGLIGPANIPAAVVKRLNDEANKVLMLPETANHLEVEGVVPAGGTPRHFGDQIAKEVAMWEIVARQAGIPKPEPG